MSALRGRLAALEHRLRPRGRIAVVSAALPPEGVPGAIMAIPAGVLLIVPENYAADPTAGLTPEQRGVIRDGDTVIGVCYADRNLA